MLTGEQTTLSKRDYDRLREAAVQAQARSELMGREFEEHVDSHNAHRLRSRAAPPRCSGSCPTARYGSSTLPLPRFRQRPNS
jgi:hypothetical protein